MKSAIYAGENDKNIYVVFGGKISVGLVRNKCENQVGLTLQEMNDMHEVGENKTEPFDKEKPTICLLFEDAKSIDVVLKTLLDAKRILQDVHDK